MNPNRATSHHQLADKESEVWRPQIPTERAYALDELRIWSTPLSGIRMTTGYQPVGRSNPVYSNGRLFATTFAPGTVIAHDAETGEQCWKLDLDAHGRESVLVGDGALYAASTYSVF